MSWLHALRHRLRVRLDPEGYARERAQELRFHIAMEARHGGRDARPTGARRDALSPDPFRHPDQERGPMRLSVLDWLRHDLSYALRGMARSPGFAVMVVVTLALGVGANAAVFSVLDRVFGQAPAGVSDPGELRRLYVNFPDRVTASGVATVSPSFAWSAFSLIRDATDGVAQMVAWTPADEVIARVGGTELPVGASFVTHDFFSALGVAPAHGRGFAADEGDVDVPAPVAVIGHGLWKRAFGLDRAVLGRSIELDEGTFTIVGVAGEGFSGLDLSRTDLFLPVGARGSRGSLRIVARLTPDGDDRVVAARGTPAYQRYLSERGQPGVQVIVRDSTAFIEAGSIIEARGPGPRSGAVSVSTRVAGVTAIVLLIACANVAGLLLVRARRRRREIAVRLALGVSRARLLSQLVIESLLLAAVAGGVAVLLSVWGGAVLRSLLLPDVRWAEPAADLRTIAFTLATAVAVGLLAGLAPGLQARRVDLSDALKAGARAGGARRARSQTALLVAQAALCVVLLAGAGLFLRSLGQLSALRLGYDVETLLLGWVSGPGDADQMAEAASRVAAVPGIAGVALSISGPMGGFSITSVFLPDRDSVPQLRPGERPRFNSVSADYFTAAGVRILAGRPWREGEADVVVVNETMAHTFWPGESAVGKCVMIGNRNAPCASVVGVAENARLYGIIEEPSVHFFQPLQQSVPTTIVVRADPARWGQAAAALQAELHQRFDGRAVTVQRMSDVLAPQLRPWRLGAQLFTAFGALALLVTLVGIYSVMAYAVSQRTHEMGVRIALGARTGSLLRLVVGESARVTLLGVVLGLAVALALGRVVESLLFGVTPRDPLALAAAAAVLLAAGLLASLVPAWRAARVDPVCALAAE